MLVYCPTPWLIPIPFDSTNSNIIENQKFSVVKNIIFSVFTILTNANIYYSSLLKTLYCLMEYKITITNKTTLV